MKSYTKRYLQHFGYSISDFIPCEIPDCGQRAVDICHIDARGMGGNPSGDKDDIENLMAKCRQHHHEYGDKKHLKDWLKEVHLKFMKANGKKTN
jgi:hypothetical protein